MNVNQWNITNIISIPSVQVKDASGVTENPFHVCEIIILTAKNIIAEDWIIMLLQVSSICHHSPHFLIILLPSSLHDEPPQNSSSSLHPFIVSPHKAHYLPFILLSWPCTKLIIFLSSFHHEPAKAHHHPLISSSWTPTNLTIFPSSLHHKPPQISSSSLCPFIINPHKTHHHPFIHSLWTSTRIIIPYPFIMKPRPLISAAP